MSHAAATAINQSVETELVAAQLIDDIKVTETHLRLPTPKVHSLFQC